MKIAAILACYNRREKTLACLESLLGHDALPGAELSVYLLDDASPDDTGAAVHARFPQVNLLRGDGTYYWNGGMRVAFGAAIATGYDFYLWLNDDVALYEGFLGRLMIAYQELAARHGPRQILVGAVRDPQTGALTYSGMRSISRWHPMKFRKLEPDPQFPRECDTMNGNCVLIPADNVATCGNLDGAFTHAMGDMDYGFRARKQGARIWVAPGYVGACEGNDKRQRWEDADLSLGERLRILNSPHGLPLREYAYFMRQNGGLLWPLFALLPYIRLVSSAISKSR